MVYNANGHGYWIGLPLLTGPLTGNERLAVDTELGNGLTPQTGVITTGMLTAFSGTVAMVAGRFYGIPDGSTQAAVLTAASTLYAYPVFISSPVAIATFNIGVTTGQTGGAAHLGVYADNGAGYPGSLVYDTGAIAGLTTTAVVTNTPTTPVALNPGIYWFASIYTASGTYPSVTGTTAIYGSALNAALGSDTAAHALAVSGQATTGISVAGTYGALPATFTTGATLTENATTPIFVIGV